MVDTTAGHDGGDREAETDGGAVDPDRVSRFARDLRSLGLVRGGTVMVHSALRQVDRERRGLADDLLEAFRKVLGPETGTLVVPGYTQWNSRTSHEARKAMVTDPSLVRMRGFNRADPLPKDMGIFAETVRSAPGSRRSRHPQTSMIALGREASALTRGHLPGSSHFGPHTPMDRLVSDSNAVVVAIGVGWGRISVPHWAEYLWRDNFLRYYHCKVDNRPGSSWLRYADVHLDDSDFPEMGRSYLESGGAAVEGLVGGAPSLSVPVRDYAHHCVAWMNRNRRPHSISRSSGIEPVAG